MQPTMGRPVALWVSPQVLSRDTAMTAIGVAGTEVGYVIAADGRFTLDDETRRDARSEAISKNEGEEAQKIFPIIDRKALAYAVAGFITIGDDFNVLEVLKKKMDTLSKRNFATCKKYFEAVASKVANELNKAKRTKRIDKLPTYRKTEGAWTILEVVLVG